MRKFDPLANVAMAYGDGREPTAKDFEQFRRSEANEAEGLCPNGCGPITWLDAHTRECAICKFHGWSNMPNKEWNK